MKIEDYTSCTFRFGGRGPKQYDCYGLAKAIYKDILGIELPEFTTPELLNDIYIKCDTSKKYFKRLDKVEPYSLVTFIIKYPLVSHVGVVLPDTKHFIHAFKNTGVCIQKLHEPVWKNKIEGFYTYEAS